MAECPGVHKLAEMKDGLLARIRVPGGCLSAKNLSKIASIAETYGNGIIDLTNRANLQIRSIDPKKQKSLIEDLTRSGLISKDPVHDRLRNIAIDPLSGLVEEMIDCRTIAQSIDQMLSDFEHKHLLSHKFSIVVDGGGPSCISGLGSDIALVASKQAAYLEKGVRFQLWLGGQKTPLECCASTVITSLNKWLKILTKLSSPNELRMKELVKTITLEDLINELSGEKGSYAKRDKNLASKKKLNPLVGTIEQTEKRKVAVNLSAPISRLQFFQATGLAELSKDYSQGEVRLTPWQAVIFPSVNEEHVAELWEKSEALGLLTQADEQKLTIISCAGSQGCIHGGFETKLKALQIREALGEMSVLNPVNIHLSACEKGCASREKAALMVMQRRSETQPRLYVNAAPSTKEPGKLVIEQEIVAEIKKLI